jgi:hypothetical protein
MAVCSPTVGVSKSVKDCTKPLATTEAMEHSAGICAPVQLLVEGNTFRSSVVRVVVSMHDERATGRAVAVDTNMARRGKSTRSVLEMAMISV